MVTIYGLPGVSCVITNKLSYMDDKTWAKVVKLVAPGIIKIKVINVAYVSPILLSINLTLYICTSKLSAVDS